MEIGMICRKSFFDQPAVMRAVDSTRRRNLAQQGRFIQRAARRLIRPARRKRLDEMSSDERRQYRAACAIAEREGRRITRRPFAPSRPGEPPRGRTGLLRNRLFFSYDSRSQSVVVGPEAAGPRTADVLESGGTVRITAGPNRGQMKRVEPRPFMGPAHEAFKPTLARIWRDSIR